MLVLKQGPSCLSRPGEALTGGKGGQGKTNLAVLSGAMCPKLQSLSSEDVIYYSVAACG